MTDRYQCDECGGMIVETAAGRECEDCHKRFPPLRMDGGNERPQSGKCPNCGTVSDRAIESVAPEFTEFDCRNENCRCEVFRIIHGRPP